MRPARLGGYSHRKTEILFWRTTKGAEVDFVIETGRRLLPVEVKAAASVHPGDVRHLHTFLDEYSDMAQRGIILYEAKKRSGSPTAYSPHRGGAWSEATI